MYDNKCKKKKNKAQESDINYKMSNVMIITRGYPASGKSTWARSWVAENPDNRIEVNRDNVRKIINCHPVGTKAQENMITDFNNNVIHDAINNKKDIVISDTNMRDRYVKQYMRVAFEHDYQVEFQDFIVEYDELIRRDKNRDDSVGEQVIRMYKDRFPYKNWTSKNTMMSNMIKEDKKKVIFEPIYNDPSQPKAVIFDVDGTIATMQDRSPFDWHRVGEDTVNDNIVNIMNMYRNNGYKIIIFSGRDTAARDFTIQWFKDNDIHYDEFHMRGDDSNKKDTRKDDIIKYEMVKKHIENKYYVETVFDDRDQVVSMWRTIFDNPTICCQVNYGNF